MNSSTVADRREALRLLWAYGAKSLRRHAARPLRALEILRRHAPERLLLAPQDLRTADPTAAADVYAGYFVFDGKVVNVHGRSPFEVESPTEAWAEALAGFAWLRHLRAADTPLARANARALVEDWIALHRRPNASPAWRPEPTARRLLSWLSQSPLILQGADLGFHRRFMRALGRNAAQLERALREGLQGRARLLALVALAEFALCASGLEKLKRRATALLEAEILLQIHGDGGHVSRNPQILLDLLLDLLPLRQVYASRGSSTPRALFNAVDRMGPMLRLFRHGDGDLALFNGMGATQPDDLATALAYDDARARPLMNAPASGYVRLETVGCVLIADVGRPPPPIFSQEAHAGALAFELSSLTQRLVVNCGSAAGRPDLRAASRATAAHSTLTLADFSSSRFAEHAGLGRWAANQIVSGPQQVEVRRSDDSAATSLEASHDGYERRFNLLHRRRLRLAKAGDRLEGEDALLPGRLVSPPPATLDFTVRFHLHPAAEVATVQQDQAIKIRLPDGQIWIFRCEGDPPTVEESIFFGTRPARPSRQIALRRNLAKTHSLSWSFAREP